MNISDPNISPIRSELKLLLGYIDLKGKHLLELGCGRADKTKALHDTQLPAEIVAFEVDTLQLQHNIAAFNGEKNIHFRHGGAEAIDVPNASFDVVLMFKSLHHVPVARMYKALEEITRVLKPGGQAWISEPVFAGDFNEILKIFHDEQLVRKAAFAAIEHAVQEKILTLQQQIFFRVRNFFRSFDDFKSRIIDVTHTQHQLTANQLALIKAAFMVHSTPTGAEFFTPQRVDLLQKPS